MERPNYIPSPLMERIHKLIFSQHSPHAFAVADFGDGPVLTYRNNQCKVNALTVHLIRDGQRVAFSHRAKPPYLFAVAQEGTSGPLLLSLYQTGPTPLIESDGASGLTGHIIALAQSPDGTNQAIAQALFLLQNSHVLADVHPKGSLLLESHPELCDHLLMGSILVESLLEQLEDRGCSK